MQQRLDILPHVHMYTLLLPHATTHPARAFYVLQPGSLRRSHGGRHGTGQCWAAYTARASVWVPSAVHMRAARVPTMTMVAVMTSPRRRRCKVLQRLRVDFFLHARHPRTSAQVQGVHESEPQARLQTVVLGAKLCDKAVQRHSASRALLHTRHTPFAASIRSTRPWLVGTRHWQRQAAAPPAAGPVHNTTVARSDSGSGCACPTQTNSGEQFTNSLHVAGDRCRLVVHQPCDAQVHDVFGDEAVLIPVKPIAKVTSDNADRTGRFNGTHRRPSNTADPSKARRARLSEAAIPHARQHM